MKFTKEQLSEENYSGVRRIQISNPMITKYKAEIDKYQKQANPALKKMEAIGQELDPFYKMINQHQQEINKIKEEMAPVLERYNVELKKVELIDQKAQAIKNKLQPIVDKCIEGKLEEFEKPTNLVSEKGFFYVEVSDTLEDFIKARRASKGVK